MIGALGLALSIVGAASAILGTVAAVRVAQGRWSLDVVIRAAWCTALALAAANMVMVVALVVRDFSVAYVAQVGSRETPLLYTVASLWAALEGSILFWAALLAAVAVLLVVRTRHDPDRERLAIGVGVLLALTAFFTLIVVGPGDPWRRISPVPLDGPGPNPLLQDHPLMAIHPPLLYLGFVGLAVPFALTVDALIRGRLDADWLRLARRWTLGPWIFLTLGLVAGAWWSYAVLGWGGYWGWDPVENVALLPWLTATAFLHSAMVGRRGGLLVTWNVGLVVASFGLTLFATLVTRSGVLDSVHAFTRSAIGPLFVGLLGATLVGSLGLVALRLPNTDEGRALGARGRGFLLNNLLFAAIAATVFFGTIFPIVAEAITATRVSIGAPYFERLVGPLAVGLLALMGIGPSLPWGGWSTRSREALLPGAIAAVVVAVSLVLTGLGSAAVAGGAVGTFALVQSIWFIVRRARRRDARAGGRIRSPNGRAIGGLVSHVGFAVLALAVVASSVGKREVTVSLRPGASADVLGRVITYSGNDERAGPNRTVISAAVSVGDAGSATQTTPALNVFRTSAQAIATPAIVPGFTADLYVTLLDLEPGTGKVTLRVGLHPFVSWIWPAGGLVALGGLLALLSVRTDRARRSAPETRQPAAGTAEVALDGVGH